MIDVKERALYRRGMTGSYQLSDTRRSNTVSYSGEVRDFLIKKPVTAGDCGTPLLGKKIYLPA